MMWVVVNPIGVLPIFLAATSKYDQRRRSRTAIEAILISCGILFFFVVFGQLLLDALGIPLNSFRIAGSVVLFLFALTMIFGPSSTDGASQINPSTEQNVAIFPLSVPAIAGPGSMLAVVVLTDNNRFSVIEQALTTATVMVVLGLTLALLLFANPVYRFIGASGASIVGRVMGLILAAIAANGVLEGIEQRFFTP